MPSIDDLELLHPLDPPIEIRFADEGRAIVEVWRE